MTIAMTTLEPEDKPVCIHTAHREHILSRDWDAVHVTGDRAEPLKNLGERPRRLWRR